MFSSLSSKFDRLPARPPTPPREISKAVDDALSFLDDCNEVDRLLSKSSHTEKDASILRSESSPASLVSEGNVNASKRVDFSPHTTCYNIPDAEQVSSPYAKSSKKSSIPKPTKPLRSILKSTNALAPPTPEDLNSKLSSFSPQVPGSFAKMLQSVIQQLAGPSRSLRLDAYLALNGVLRTYENVPDVQAMSQKMVPITQFLTRDLAWKDPAGNLDVNIITQALKLTTAILFNNKLAQALDEDFETFVVDRSLAVLEQPDIPKAIIKSHMFLLAQQRFNSQIMTAAKVDKLVTALQTIEDRCTGNSVTGSRLAVYSRLFAQAPGVMLTRIRDWLEHLFHGMLSSVQVVQAKAIEVSTQAALRFGQQPLATKGLRELFETEVEEGQTYCDFFISRLSEMIADKETTASVPPIWASVVLFFRCKRSPLERWPTFKSWLLLIQRCFNSSDITVRYHASLAWNKLVFAIMPDASTPKNLMSMLRVPITAGMEKPGSDKFSHQIRSHAADSYYNLLHYGFRPGLSTEEYDCAWDIFVTPLLFKLAKCDSTGRKRSMRVLHGLINGNTGVWKADAAPEQIAIKPEDLPKLDPRWIRSRLGKLLRLLESRLLADTWHFEEPNANIGVVWQVLMQSIADAGSQEVRTSNELKQAIALLVNLLHRLWNGYNPQQTANNGSLWLERYIALIQSMITPLGTAAFVEDILLRTKDDVIEVAPTPSHRHAKDHAIPQSPLVIILGQFYHLSSEMAIDSAYQDAASRVLKIAIASKPSFQSKLELLSRTQQSCSQRNVDAPKPLINERLWGALATSTMSVLEHELHSAGEQQSQSFGMSLRHAVDILTAGLTVASDDQSHKTMKELYDAINESAKVWAGEGAVVLSLMEPFAKSLATSNTLSVSLDKRLDLACHVLRTGSWPRNRQSIEQARKSLWGVGLASNKTAVFDPFEHVYALILDLAVSLYGKSDDSSTPDVHLAQQLFTSVIEFLERCPTSVLGPALRKTQDAFALWILDKSRKTGAIDTYLDLVQTAWSRILRLVDGLPNKDTNLLIALEKLLVAGFSSPYRAVVNTTIVFWNETFGRQEDLLYPPTLESVLRARAVDADILLPNFSTEEDHSPPLSLPAFYESQSQTAIPPNPPKLLGEFKSNSRHSSTSQPNAQSPYFKALRSPLRQQISASSPAKKTGRSSAGSTPKPRLRHDDSQIQFAPIDSSPLVPEDESQLLTEHQKEVKARQFQDAQLFPNLSSSPLAKSTALQRVVPKRLDFTSSSDEQQENKDPGTPVGLPDGHGLMSDDLPSSPTPSASKGADQLVTRADEDEEMEDAPEEPPSSPPRAPVDAENPSDLSKEVDTGALPIETTAAVTVSEKEALVASSRSPSPEPNQELDADIQNSDLPSDTDLPTMQLQQEAEEAIEVRERSSIGAAENEEEQIAKSEEVAPSQKNSEPTRILESTGTEKEASPQEVPDGAAEDEVTTVEDSFYGPGAANAKAETQPPTHSQQSPSSQRGGRKRKRSKSVLFTTKKRRQQSSLTRNYNDQDDDDIGEEIVVAGSQRSSSQHQVSSSVPSAPANPAVVKMEAAAEPTNLEGGENDTAVMQAPPKRGRGRPRKSATPVPSPAEQTPRKSLKRKASTLSNRSSPEVQVFSSFVQATPPQGTAGKQLNNNSTQANSAPEEQTTTADDPATPEKQLQGEQAAATSNRRIATPRSILKRLRDALTDFKGMIMGSQEEREFDNVLFEFRKEVHDAARRGIM